MFDKLARGEVREDPFPKEEIDNLALHAEDLLRTSLCGPLERACDREQPIRVRLLQAILKGAGDPDWKGMNWFATGIRVGVGVRLPRTPAVFARKKRWRLPEQADPEAWRAPPTESVWRENYRSAQAEERELERQLGEMTERGLCLKLTQEEARIKFPGLLVSSLGAVVKEPANPGGERKVRMVLDGTHGVKLNERIRVRDQDRCPTAADVKRQQREQDSYRRGLGLAVDVREAHRLPVVDERDWRFQGCRARTCAEVYIFKVGVFGVSSIAYWWARLGGACIRAAHYLASPTAELWVQLMADDIKVECTNEHPKREIICFLLSLSLLGVPMSWGKIQGGEALSWIGYSVLVRELALGITEARAQWAIGWLAALARDRLVEMDRFRTGLGRMSFICGALEFDRPMLATLYVFSSFHRCSALRPVPLYVSCVAAFLAERIQQRRHYPSASRTLNRAHAPRVDARAEGSTIGLGGWLPREDEKGEITKGRSPWFAVNLNERTAPWAYCRSGEPYRTIAALEAMAVLLSVIAFGPMLPSSQQTLLTVTGITDNRGNSFGFSRLVSTRFPLAVVVMELSAQLEKKNWRLDMQWAPRDLNQEADALSNGNTAGFHPENRVEIDPEKTPWIILDRMMHHGLKFEEERKKRVRRRTGRKESFLADGP